MCTLAEFATSLLIAHKLKGEMMIVSAGELILRTEEEPSAGEVSVLKSADWYELDGCLGFRHCGNADSTEE